MTLIDYIKPMDREALEAFSVRCGTTPGQIRQVAYGRRASAELAIRIDRGSDGRVSSESLRPDIDWEYLRSKPKAA